MCDHTLLRPTQVNMPCLYSGQTYSMEGWEAELTLLSVIYLDCLSVRRQSPIPVVTSW